MKVFQLLMHNTEEHEYLHRGTHGSTSLCSWKPKKQPTYSPPFFCQPKQPLSQFSAKNPNTSGFSPPHWGCCASRSRKRSKESAICSALKTSFKETKKPNPSLSVCEEQKAHVIQGNSQLAVYPQTKALGRMKGKLGCLLALLSGPLAEPQIASLLFTMQP